MSGDEVDDEFDLRDVPYVQYFEIPQSCSLNCAAARSPQQEGIRGSQAPRSTFDALIALTARAVGATVITCNGEDFDEIRHCEPFELVVWRWSSPSASP